MSGLAQILRFGVRRDGSLDRMCPVVGRYASSNTLCRFDRYGEVRGVMRIGISHHQWQTQLGAALPRQRQADQATTVRRHVIDILGPHFPGRHNKVR